MSEERLVSLDIDNRGIARLTLNRPDARNALSDELMQQLRHHTKTLAEDHEVRAVILTGAGDVFCAGGDLKGMKRQAANTREGRIEDASEFARTLRDLDRLPKPLIGRINGPAYGGGVGLISLCDITVGLASSTYRLTEVTLGLIAATISPYVVARIGVPHARRMMLNALPLDAALAHRLGLLDVVCDSVEELDKAVETEVTHLLKCAPEAAAASKSLIRYVSTHDADENFQHTVNALADAWETEEIREGINAFLEKRKPDWDAS
ncbi:MAG: enoyl-CoA hydratase/isomerase family protein [Planctomycetaceae bacterium]|nr:enoyl-CoA hydratase/isomerase family protein [Planctomycetaceae bacterium]